MSAKQIGFTAAVLFGWLALALGAWAEDDSFVRLHQDGKNAALQTAYATYRSPDSKVEIVLYGAVHIADAEYYQRVQSDLDSFDTVLYELVKPENPETQPTEEMKSLGELQKTMGELLGLSFQKDGIDYTRKHFVHADMTFEEFQAALGPDSGGLSPFGGLIDGKTLARLMPILKMAAQFGKALMDGNPEMRDGLKLQLAGQLSNVKNIEQQLGQKMAQVILQQRNEVAMKVLASQLEKQKEGTIGIFYGAAHLPDFDARLRALGYEPVEKKWVSAWQIGGGIPSDPPASREATPRAVEENEEELVPAGSEDGKTWN